MYSLSLRLLPFFLQYKYHGCSKAIVLTIENLVKSFQHLPETASHNLVGSTHWYSSVYPALWFSELMYFMS